MNLGKLICILKWRQIYGGKKLLARADISPSSVPPSHSKNHLLETQTLCVFQGGLSRALCYCPQWERLQAGTAVLPKLLGGIYCRGRRTLWKVWEEKGDLWEALESVFEEGSPSKWWQSPMEGLQEPWGHTVRASEAMTGMRPLPGGARGSVWWW